jgi:ADP-ribosyl-[dinitrogen reductase] hydrolase
VGTAVEFKRRGSFPPLTDMVGGGVFDLEPGQWTDDTSMALCLAESLLERGFDAADQMQRYVRWWTEGYQSSTGRCFDIGLTTKGALQRFRETGEPFSGSADPRSAGNGSLMRLAPVVLYHYPNLEAIAEFSGESSRTTHAAPEAIECCRLFGVLLGKALRGDSKEALTGVSGFSLEEPAVARIAGGGYRSREPAEIRGTGYCVESLEAALWCFQRTNTFGEAVLVAANLGEDADTTAAITGQLAGAHYGIRGIPLHWLERVSKRKEIQELADQLYGASRNMTKDVR